ncbi:MAG: ATP-dependent zinc metalloprotease FtsH [Actinobacteria bacterium]|nr:ATP-dependent zinc metalloprotease FtsH [Actinomycetota bacterium]
MRKSFKNIFFILLLIASLIFLLKNPIEELTKQDITHYSLSMFESKVKSGEVQEVLIMDKSQTINGILKNGTKFTLTFPSNYQITETLIENDVKVEIDAENPSQWLGWIINFLPVALMIGIMLFFLSQIQGSGSKILAFGKSKAKLVAKDQPGITFKDVGGLYETLEELKEIAEFLENPAKFHALGAKIPKGVLLYGPPGSGKTLLARAVAGEAKVPFFQISGSEFVELFVGVGASRVRDLFDQAKANEPCIVFIDEIDAVGRHRGAGIGGGHDEREQTLNQLLVEMDGFNINDSIIVMAATNRPDILDQALLRTGRFDRRIVVNIPDIKEREDILRIHMKGKPAADDVNISVIARQTPGFTGADLENLLNEAALLTARYNKRNITMKEVQQSIERIIAGPEKKSRIISDEEKKIIAYHEAGHALVACYLPHADPIHKISVISRGMSLGYTITLPEQDRYLISRSELTDNLTQLLGGRASEEIVFNEITTGAQNDLEKSTKIARQMVCEFGMSDKIGPLTLGDKQGAIFLGRDFSAHPDYSEQVAYEIDKEIRKLVDDAYNKARDILNTHRNKLDLIAQNLIEKETLNKEEIEELLKDEKEKVEEIETKAEFEKDIKKDTIKRETIKRKKPLITPKPVLEGK